MDTVLYETIISFIIPELVFSNV